MIIKKEEHKSNYTCVSNDIIQNKDLSLQAKGLLVYLLSLPADWEVHKTEIWKHHKNGRDSVFRAWKELQQLGYITEKKYREKGRFQTQYTIHEEPCLKNRSGLSDAVFQKVQSTNKQSLYITENPERKISNGQRQEKSIEELEEELEKLKRDLTTSPKWLKEHLMKLIEKTEKQIEEVRNKIEVQNLQ